MGIDKKQEKIENDSAGSSVDSSSDSEGDSRGFVLIVDDDIDVLAANARFLRVSGYRVIVNNQATSALEQVKEEAVQVVVTDLRMPEMDGLEFARQARGLKPLLPMLFFSAYGSVPDVVSAMQLGAIDFLAKPVDPEVLIERLDDICLSGDSVLNQRAAFDDTESDTPFRLRVLAFEKYLIETSLRKHQGSVGAVLDELKINRRTLNEKMSRLGIHRNQLK